MKGSLAIGRHDVIVFQRYYWSRRRSSIPWEVHLLLDQLRSLLWLTMSLRPEVCIPAPIGGNHEVRRNHEESTLRRPSNP